jgi:hypothetical protein
MLDSVKKDDAAIGRDFDAGKSSKELVECQDAAEDLEGAIEGRYIAAASLCDWRSRDGGVASSIFKAGAAPLRQRVLDALTAAAKAKGLPECTRLLAEAKPGFDELQKFATAECSPESDRKPAACEAKLKVTCEQFAKGASTVPGVTEVLKCLSESENSRSPGPDFTRGAAAADRSLSAGAALQTAILTGAADFFVERAEQELSMFAAEVLSRKLCEKESPTRAYLPNTCGLLMPCSDGTSKPGCNPEAPVIGATPAALRAAAKADLENLPKKAVEAIARKDVHLACAVAFSWGVAEEVGQGAELAEILKDPKSVLAKPLVETHCKAHRASIEALALHIKAQLSGDPALVGGALRSGAQDRMVALDGSLALDPEASQAVREILRRLAELDRAVTNYRQNPSDEARARLVIAAVQVTVPVMTYLAPTDAQKEDIYTTVDLFSQVLNHDYAAAVVTASQLKVVAVMPANARNLLGLAASLAQAKTSDDVRQTLEDAALPLGSWRRKNELRGGATLTGMVGFHFGLEHVLETPYAKTEINDGWSAAPALLVGVDLHHGLSKKTRLGVHLNLLDLGALASIRLEKPEAEGESSDDVEAQANPEVRIEQVFAPGVFPYFGVGPLDFGPAITFVPSLRGADTPEGHEPLDVVRFGFVAAVDVSVLPLF